MIESTKKSKSILNILTMAVMYAVFGAGICMLMTLGTVGTIFKQTSGRFDRKRLELVVAQVRVSGLSQGEMREFMLESSSNPQSIHPLKSGLGLPIGSGAGHVWAEVSSEGKLKVVIETRDLGHAGEFGFAYSDSPLVPDHDSGSHWLQLNVPGHLNWALPTMKIDNHWWKVENNLQ